LLGRERRQLGVGYGHDALATLLQDHRRGDNRDLEPAVCRVDVQHLTGLEPERVPEPLRHDDPARGIDGSLHGTDHAIRNGIGQTRLGRISAVVARLSFS
jgi:hypothetical protein